MPDVPTALPDKAKVRALIRARGYSISELARKLGRPPASLFAITGRTRPTSVTLLRQVAGALSTRANPVRISDISDWTGDEDESEPETQRLSA